MNGFLNASAIVMTMPIIENNRQLLRFFRAAPRRRLCRRGHINGGTVSLRDDLRHLSDLGE